MSDHFLSRCIWPPVVVSAFTGLGGSGRIGRPGAMTPLSVPDPDHPDQTVIHAL